MHVHVYVKMQNFIELPPISTQLYHIKYNRLVNVYISPEKREKKSRYLCNSMTDLHKIWHCDAERVSHVKN